MKSLINCLCIVVILALIGHEKYAEAIIFGMIILMLVAIITEKSDPKRNRFN